MPSAVQSAKEALVQEHYTRQLRRRFPDAASLADWTEIGKLIADWTRDATQDDGVVDWPGLVDGCMETQRKARESKEPRGFPWGLTKLDRWVTMEPGHLYVLGGIKKGAKSLFVLATMLHNLLSDPPTPCAFFSLEMPGVQVFQKIASYATDINSHTILSQFVTDRQMETLEGVAPGLRTVPLYICEDPAISAEGIGAILRRWKSQHDLQDNKLIVVVDFLQYMQLKVHRWQSEPSALKDAAFALARLAKEFRCAVIAVAQLRNEAEGQEPHLRFLEGSGGIAQAAEAILLVDLLHRREGKYDAQDWPKPFDVLVAAQRSGESGVKVNCLCDLRVGKFYETVGT
jgi:replicative DNA helicase